MSASDLVRRSRQSAGLTQGQLAERIGIAQASVARLERRGANPTVSTLQRVLRATGHRLKIEAEERPSSVDETLIATYLRLSPSERLDAFQSNHRAVARLRALAQEDEPAGG